MSTKNLRGKNFTLHNWPCQLALSDYVSEVLGLVMEPVPLRLPGHRQSH